MKPRVLGIQFRASATAVQQEQSCIDRYLLPYCETQYISALDASLAWHKPAELLSQVDALVLGGSGEFDFDGDRSADDPARTISATFLNRLTPLLEQVFAQDVPTFGICYGHQLIGAFSGVSVVYSEKEKKSCSHEVYLNDEQERGPLLHGIPEQFHANYGHKDVLETIPDGATLLMAGGDLCTVSALRYKQNIYTVQFHPELTLEDMKVRLAESPSYLPEGAAVEDLYRSTPHANQLLQNFGALLASRAVER